MKPIPFEGQNCVFAENQSEYNQLPAYKHVDGQVICCWKLSWPERVKILLSGILWQSVLTFNRPLQPQFLSVERLIATEEFAKSTREKGESDA
jgi:hypothetical protein